MRSLECRVRKDWHLLFTRHLDVTQLSYALRVRVGRRQGVSPACGYSVCEVVSSLSLSLAGRCGFIGRVAGGLAQVWRKAPRSMDRSRVLATCKGQWSRGQWRGSVLRLPTTTQNRCHRLFSKSLTSFVKGGADAAFGQRPRQYRAATSAVASRMPSTSAPTRQARRVVLRRSQLVLAPLSRRAERVNKLRRHPAVRLHQQRHAQHAARLRPRVVAQLRAYVLADCLDC